MLGRRNAMGEKETMSLCPASSRLCSTRSICDAASRGEERKGRVEGRGEGREGRRKREAGLTAGGPGELQTWTASSTEKKERERE
jgi:hypothetical protein